MSFVTHIDESLTTAVNRLSADWRPVMVGASWIGEPAVMGTWMLLLGLAMGDRTDRRSWWLAGMAVGSMLAINVVKLATRRVRPETYEPLLLHSYSFPSGHAFASALAMGLTARLAWQLGGASWGWPVTLLAGLIILVVGTSRIYVGAHFPTDVLGGWLLALVAGVIICKLTQL